MDPALSSILFSTVAAVVGVGSFARYTIRVQRRQHGEKVSSRALTVTPNTLIILAFVMYIGESLYDAYLSVTSGGRYPLALDAGVVFTVMFGCFFALAMLNIMGVMPGKRSEILRSRVGLVCVLAVAAIAIGLYGWLTGQSETFFPFYGVLSGLVSLFGAAAGAKVWLVLRGGGKSSESAIPFACVLVYLAAMLRMGFTSATRALPVAWTTVIAIGMALLTSFGFVLLATLCISDRLLVGAESVGFAFSFTLVFAVTAVALIFPFGLLDVVFSVECIVAMLTLLFAGWRIIGRYRLDKVREMLHFGLAFVLLGVNVTGTYLLSLPYGSVGLPVQVQVAVFSVVIALALAAFWFLTLSIAGRDSDYMMLSTLFAGAVASLLALEIIKGLQYDTTLFTLLVSVLAPVIMLLYPIRAAWRLRSRATSDRQRGGVRRYTELFVALIVLVIASTEAIIPPAIAMNPWGIAPFLSSIGPELLMLVGGEWVLVGALLYDGFVRIQVTRGTGAKF
jgi:hypothetical protein